MAFTQADFSRRASLPIRQAMAKAITRFISQLTFFNPGAFQFAEVFEEWAGYLDRVVYPAAVILPGAWRYADSEFTPALIRRTMEPVDFNGTLVDAGFALYKLAEFEQDMELSFRATSPGERDAILLGLESAFRSPELLSDNVAGARNGVILDLPEYYSLPGRFAVTSARVEDNPDSAMRNVRDAVLIISGQAQQVAVGPVRPMSVRVDIREDC